MIWGAGGGGGRKVSVWRVEEGVERDSFTGIVGLEGGVQCDSFYERLRKNNAMFGG